MTINILPDDVLLLIFYLDRVIHFDPHRPGDRLHRPWRWHRLVHVCRRWRSVVFASPTFLDLRLVCYPGTTVELTRIWPPFPIIITDDYPWEIPEYYEFDVASEHPNRVCQINLVDLLSSKFQRLVSAMQRKFPALTHLDLGVSDSYGRMPASALPDGFLGGSAPHLQSLGLSYIPFPALPKLLLSSTDLVCLALEKIPNSGYISPEAIVTSLAMLTNLKFLTLGFHSPRSHSDQEGRRIPPPTRSVLPTLTRFQFKGVVEYLEDLVARIDTPLLDSIWITFFHQRTFDIPQLAHFMRRTPRFQELNEAYVDFGDSFVQVGYFSPTKTSDENSGLRIISCEHLRWLFPSLAHIFTSLFPSIHMVENLCIYEPRYFPRPWPDDPENMQFLEIFRPFVAAKNLYVGDRSQAYFARALREFVWGGMTEVLPSLQNIFMESLQSYFQEDIGEFIVARQLSGHSITVSLWERAAENSEITDDL